VPFVWNDGLSIAAWEPVSSTIETARVVRSFMM